MTPANILLIRNDRLGDLILSLPVAAAVKHELPGSSVTYLAAPGPAGISGMVKDVDNWIIDRNSKNRRLGLFELSNLIHKRQFDVLVELKPSWRTAAAGCLAKVPLRIGTSRRAYSLFYNARVKLHRKGSGRHQTDLDLALLAPLGISASGISPTLSLPQDIIDKAKELVAPVADRYIVIHPESGGSAPNWPESNYKQLSSMLLESTKFSVVITGSENIGAFDGCLNLLGKTSLEQLAGVIYGAALFISGSTGPLHMADALGKKCLSFFVDRDDIGPSRWGPRRNLGNVMTGPGGPCACADPNQCRCLERITPQMAFDKAISLLER
jgi:ADP-heptose:LPS heptosyltransferase